MSTIKLDHIKLLTGASNFDGWKHGISQVLQGEGYWGHVEGDADIYSAFPIEAEPVAPTVVSTPVIGHENAHARMSAFLAIISAIFTKLLQLKWSETDNCI